MKDNSSLKYIKYAIGEIVLVVIGILIALQINAWYENYKQKLREKVLLEEIHHEFVANKKQLEKVVAIHKKALRSCDKVINEFPIDKTKVNLDSLSVYMFDSGWRFTFNPSQGSINSLINTSSFETISNNKLRKLVVSWPDIVRDYQEDEETAKFITINYLEPFYNKHFPYSLDLNYPKTNLDALESLEFEHLMERRRETLTDILDNPSKELEKIQETIDQIIELTETR